VILEKMANDLDLSPVFLQSLARGASYEYKTYTIPKRAGGLRTVHHPSRRLKAVSCTGSVAITLFASHRCTATAYRQGRSVLDNATIHAGSRYLLRMDLTRFFESIKEADVREYIAQRSVLFSGWSELDVELFCKFVCRNSALTIGSPSSPGLSNAICYDLDVALFSASRKREVAYTRYADDLFFSAKRPNVLIPFQKEVEEILGNAKVPGSLEVNASKTRHSSKRGARRVTGIVLGSDGQAYIGRALKRRIRALVFTYKLLGSEDRAKLAGLIAYAKSFDPQFVNSLIQKYGLPPVREAMTAPLMEPKITKS
jgi:RNA-directed DNA polymerase